MHFGFLFYTLYAVLGKLAAKEIFLSKHFIILYSIVFLLMAFYALIWQQVLKTIPLSIGIANKSITIVWGMIFGKFIFNDQIKINNILGALLILSGILILILEKKRIG